MHFALKAAITMATLLPGAAEPRAICKNVIGTDRGHFYSFWYDSGSGCMQRLRDGRYRVHWRLGTSGNLVAGSGWAKGSYERKVRYTAHVFQPGHNGYLALYGWSVQPLIEYYVVDNWGDYAPPGPDTQRLGTVISDGGTYAVYRTLRIDQPSIVGKATFSQYWSVRSQKRPIGHGSTITFPDHVAAWRKLGLELGILNYQIMATEGYASNGQSDIDVAEDLH